MGKPTRFVFVCNCDSHESGTPEESPSTRSNLYRRCTSPFISGISLCNLVVKYRVDWVVRVLCIVLVSLILLKPQTTGIALPLLSVFGLFPLFDRVQGMLIQHLLFVWLFYPFEFASKLQYFSDVFQCFDGMCGMRWFKCPHVSFMSLPKQRPI